MNKPQPIYGIPALKIDNTYVVADLHIGVESHLMKKGFHLVSRTDYMLNTISKTADGCDHLIILGDVKDTVPGSSKQEYREIPDFFEHLKELFSNIDIVVGNHDTNIEKFLPTGIRIKPPTGMKIGNIGYVHGHMWPSENVMKCKLLIMAHEHPAVMFRDGVGKQTIEPCWVKGRFTDGNVEKYKQIPDFFIIIPSFNRMLGGSPMNINNGNFLNPLISNKYVDIDNAELFLLDGINLGKRSDVIVDDRYKTRAVRRECNS